MDTGLLPGDKEGGVEGDHSPPFIAPRPKLVELYLQDPLCHHDKFLNFKNRAKFVFVQDIKHIWIDQISQNF
jgi:hypothetical protein